MIVEQKEVVKPKKEPVKRLSDSELPKVIDLEDKKSKIAALK